MSSARFVPLTTALVVALILSGSPRPASAQDAAWITLFDGSSTEAWTMSGPGSFEPQPDGSLLARGGMGLYYYAERTFRDFVLEAEWKVDGLEANSGIFVRFPTPDDPDHAVRTGYEIQILEAARPMQQTGALYEISAPFRSASAPIGEWNRYRIEVRGQRYQVYLNDELVNDHVGARSREGHIGLQNHDDNARAWFRNVRVMPLPDGGPLSLADVFRVEEARDPIRVLVVTTTHGFRHVDAIDTLKAILPSIQEATEFRFTVTEDVSDLKPTTLENFDVLFFANSTLRLTGKVKPEVPAGTDAAEAGQPEPEEVVLVTAEQQQAILDFLAAGKGIAGAHAALDSFYDWDEYRTLCGGGLFQSHPWTQSVRVTIDDPANPTVDHFGPDFWLRDEIYVLDENPRPTSHVLATLDIGSVDASLNKPDPTRRDFPISWIRTHGGGRVFYTKLGHFADVWTTPSFLEHILEGLRLVAGRIEAPTW
jgi:type 1 glutamine amidotransferase